MEESLPLIILGGTIFLSMLLKMTRKIESCITPCGSCQQTPSVSPRDGGNASEIFQTAISEINRARSAGGEGSSNNV